MANMTILEAAAQLGVSKEAIHNRVRRGSLVAIEIDGVKYVDIDANAKPTASKAKPQARRTSTAKAGEEKYYKMLEEQNAQLQTKVEKLEGETRSLRDQKEIMLIQEREKIEQIYKDKDEQLKNILNTISAQFMLGAPIKAQEEEHLEAEIELPVKEEKEEKLLSLKRFIKENNYSDKKSEKIQQRFKKASKKDDRIIRIGKKFYLDLVKYDYKDLLK